MNKERKNNKREERGGGSVVALSCSYSPFALPREGGGKGGRGRRRERGGEVEPGGLVHLFLDFLPVSEGKKGRKEGDLGGRGR